jgi:hypothetical protein
MVAEAAALVRAAHVDRDVGLQRLRLAAALERERPQRADTIARPTSLCVPA